jgi:NADH-quinone oxidoreductase subunit M
MITLLLLFFPLAAALMVLATSGEQAKKIAFAASVIEFALALYACSVFTTDASVQFGVNVSWIASLGINFNVGIDGISMLMVLLTTFLVPVIILSSFDKRYENSNVFYALVLSMQMALIGVFVSLDGFLFYIFWELALIPIYFICLLWGGQNRAKITFKFFVYTLAGSLLMLAALIYLYTQSTTHSFDIASLYETGRRLSVNEQSLVFWAMFIAFAIKMPVFPFHTWQPDTYTTAPTQGTMLLSGIMLKMGTYGVIRWLIALVPLGTQEWGGVAITLSVIGVVYASCIAIVQVDFKRLIAYSSIAHVGLIAAGALSQNVQGVQGAVIQMLSHGVNVVGMFFIVDLLQHKTNTRNLHQMGGIRSVNPQFAVLFLIILLGSVALPLTNGFVGEFLLLNGLFQYSSTMAAFAGLSIILGAVYMLRSYQSIMLGETNNATAGFTSLNSNEKWVLVIVCAAVIIFGVYPKPLNDIVAASVNQLVSNLH